MITKAPIFPQMSQEVKFDVNKDRMMSVSYNYMIALELQLRLSSIQIITNIIFERIDFFCHDSFEFLKLPIPT